MTQFHTAFSLEVKHEGTSPLLANTA